MSSTSEAARTDVVVVGAGPTGLMLAGDLAEAGVRVTVLERRAGVERRRAFAVHARTMEELQIRGVADELAAPEPRSGRCDCTAGRRSTWRACPALPLAADHTPVPDRAVLTGRLDRLGVSIAHDAEVVGVRRTPPGWTCEFGLRGGAERRYRAGLRRRHGRGA